MSTGPSESNQDYLVRTADLSPDALQHLSHWNPVANTNHTYQFPLGDSTGLTKTAVHLCRLPAGQTATTLHWHTHEDEWFYVLEASPDAVILIWDGKEGETDPKTVVPREESVKPGDFLGFKAGTPRAHTFRAGEKDMLYLIGGSREELDVCHYPGVGMSKVIGREVEWTFEDKSVTFEEKKPYRK